MWMSGNMKIRFIAPDKTKEFKPGEILEARYPIGNGKEIKTMYGITNRFGEHYAYPASWFELVEDHDN